MEGTVIFLFAHATVHKHVAEEASPGDLESGVCALGFGVMARLGHVGDVSAEEPTQPLSSGR